MVFENLPNTEKVYWLNYLLRMELLYIQKNQQLHSAVYNAMQPRRRALLEEVNTFYQNFYTKVKEDLYPLVSKQALLAAEVLNFDYNNLSTFSLGYIMRDWGNGQEQEQQHLITQVIEQKLLQLGIGAVEGQALFMGCGMGRYAVDFAHRYQHVKAFDASVLMIWCIEYLQQVETWEVLSKVNRNCRRIEDTVQRMEVGITPAQKAIIASKVDFFVANAAQLSLPQKSIQHIYSIYFTDVLPLEQLYQEVDQLLIEQGLFIHFGPLEYFFNQEEQMLTAEEVRLFFQEQGYQVLVNEFMRTKHLSSENNMRHRVYDNWFFIAQKPTSKPKPVLELTSVISLNNQVELVSLGQIEQGACTAVKYEVKLGNQSYQLPEVVYELLVQINGQRSIQALLQALDLVDIDLEDQTQLLQILQELATANILNIANN